MKKIYLALIVLLAVGVLPCMGQKLSFRIDKDAKSEEEFQAYVGRKVAFYEPVNKDEKKFHLRGIKMGKPYTIHSIKTKEGNVLSDPMVIFSLIDDEGTNSSPIIIKCVIGIADKNGKSAPSFDDIPMYLVDEFNSWKETYVGTVVSIDGEPYRVIDLIWEKEKGYRDEYYNWPFVVYQNTETGSEYKEMYDGAVGGKYVSELSRVEKPADETIRYGEKTVVTDDGKTKYSYVDNVIDITIFGDSQRFTFSLKNVSDNSIKLVWNEAVFVDMKGSTCRVMHDGIKYAERNGDQPSSLIIKGAKLNDIIIPNENVEFREYKYRSPEWIINPMYPKDRGNNGQVSIMLPIQIKDTVNEYIFVFDVVFKWLHPELHTAD